MSLSLSEIARALGGEATGGQVRAPGPGHSPRDRSLTVRLSWQAPDGYIVFSHCGDDFRTCRDHVRAKLGLPNDAGSRRRDLPDDRTKRRRLSVVAPARQTGASCAGSDNADRIRRAVELWAESRDPYGTLAEVHLRSRGLVLDDDVAGHALRFHRRCAWRDEQLGITIFVPAMVAAMRQIQGDAITAIRRTRLTAEGVKVGRRMLGRASGCAIKLDADDAVTGGLHLAAGVETALAARQIGLKPTWALGSAGAIATFPILAGIEALTLFEEDDDASRRAVAQCAERWHAAGREVDIIKPKVGNDLNDALRGAA